MHHTTIFRDNNVYASHASACVAKNGDILVAFRQAPFEHIFAHVHPDASVGLARSRDNGLTWEPAVTVLDPGYEMNLNDPSLTTLSDGTILLTAFVFPCPWAENKDGWGDLALPVRGNSYYYVPSKSRILISRSFNNGETWESPSLVDTSCYGPSGDGVFASIAELSDGTLLIPITKTTSEPQKSVAALMSSRDKGKHWEPYSIMAVWHKDESTDRSFGLPSVVAYDDKHLLAAGWTVFESGTLICSSEDGGKTWSEPASINTMGACMHLTTTMLGTTLLTYGYRHEPYGIRVLPSYDHGRTWDLDKVASLRCDGAMRDLGYPRTIQLPDGRLFCVYYFNVDDKDRSYYDEQMSLQICEQWKLDPALYTYQKAGLRFIGGTFFTEDELAGMAGNTADQQITSETGPTLI